MTSRGNVCTACGTYRPQVTLGKTDYGPYTGRLYKGITKAFFPKTYAALKAVQDTQDCFGPRDQCKAKRDGGHCGMWGFGGWGLVSLDGAQFEAEHML